MRPWRLLVLAGFLPPVLAAPGEFLKPPSSRNLIEEGDFDTNPVYEFGNYAELEWTLPSNDSVFDLVLCQQEARGGQSSRILNIEVITRNVVPGSTGLNWSVNTNSDLTASNLFFLSLANEKPNITSPTSRLFNITKRETVTLNGTASSISPNATPTGGSGAPETSNTNGLTAPAIIVIAVAIPCAVILGALASWILFGRPRRRARKLEEESAQKLSDSSSDGDKSSATELGVEGELFKPAELSAVRAPAELSGVQIAIEMSVSNDAAELSPVGDAEWLSNAGRSARLLSVRTVREMQRSGVLRAHDGAHPGGRTRRWSR